MTNLSSPKVRALVIYDEPTGDKRSDQQLCKAFTGQDVDTVWAKARAWAARGLSPDAEFQIFVLPDDDITGSSRLSGLPKEKREHPLFRQGYNLGYSHRAHEEALSEFRQSGGGPVRDASAATFDVTAGQLLGRLVPGVRVVRDLIELTDDTCTTETPCCGRRITLSIPGEGETLPAVCCRCRVTYQVAVVQEDPDGYSDDEPPYVAVFVAEHLDVAAAKHRAGKWEAISCHSSDRKPL
jgi:hypothetical protein